MRRLAAVMLALMLCLSLGSCTQTENIDLPFASSEVVNVEMFRFVIPSDAEKKVITGQEDIEDLYTRLESISLKDEEREPAAGKPITGFRFNLSDGTDYEIVYLSIAVKAGRIKLPDSGKDYFTSADIGSCWRNYDYEIVKALESELPVC